MSVTKKNEIPSYVPEDVSNCFEGIPQEVQDKIIKAFMAQKDLEETIWLVHETNSDRNELISKTRDLIDKIKSMINWKKMDDFLKDFRKANDSLIKDWIIDIRLTDKDDYTYTISIDLWIYSTWMILPQNKEWFIDGPTVLSPRVADYRLPESKRYKVTQEVYDMVEKAVSL